MGCVLISRWTANLKCSFNSVCVGADNSASADGSAVAERARRATTSNRLVAVQVGPPTTASRGGVSAEPPYANWMSSRKDRLVA
jgi:hypothetical protein